MFIIASVNDYPQRFDVFLFGLVDKHCGPHYGMTVQGAQLGIQGGRFGKGQCVFSRNSRNVEGTIPNFPPLARRSVPFQKGTTLTYGVDPAGTMRQVVLSRIAPSRDGSLQHASGKGHYCKRYSRNRTLSCSVPFRKVALYTFAVSLFGNEHYAHSQCSFSRRSSTLLTYSNYLEL